jgi:hypothetical protein
MEFLFTELLDTIFSYCDMWSSFQLACTNTTLMEIFKYKLEQLARHGFNGLAQVIYGTKLPIGFAKILLVHYFKNIKNINSRSDYSQYMSFTTIEHVINNFMTINGLKDITLSNNIDLITMLNVKMSQDYKERNIAAISRLIFQLMNAGQVSSVSAIIYLQKFTPDFINRSVFGIFREKVMFWLHPDFYNKNIPKKVPKHTCKECMYGNFNYYDLELGRKLPELSCDIDCLDHHIAYAYKYINYW